MLMRFCIRVSSTTHSLCLSHTCLLPVSSSLPTRQATVLAAHEERNMTAADAFKAIDSDGKFVLTRAKLEQYVRKHVVTGRQDYGDRGQGAVDVIVNKLVQELDADKDGKIEWREFSEWNRRSSVEQVVAQLSQRHQEL